MNDTIYFALQSERQFRARASYFLLTILSYFYSILVTGNISSQQLIDIRDFVELLCQTESQIYKSLSQWSRACNSSH